MRTRPLLAVTAALGALVLPAAASAETFAIPKGTCSELSLPFGAGRMPPACWRPYADSSPWNTPIPEGARTDPRSPALVARLAAFGTPQHLVAGESGTPDDFSHPTYYAQPGDPLFTLHCTEPWGKCAIEGMEVRAPDAAQPAAGADAHMTVVDQVAGWEYDLWGVQTKPSGGGRLDFRWGGRTRIDGDGLSSDATASRVGNLAGIIRAQELAAGRIDHALFMVIYCDSGSFVYPAAKNGRSCARLGLPTDDAPPLGTRFQLDMTPAEIDALEVPEYRKIIFRAMAKYGLFAGDTGTGSWGIQLESGSTYTSFGAEDAAVAYARGAGASPSEGRYVLNIRDGVDWKRHLRVIDPCITQGTCSADAAAPAAPGPTATPDPTVRVRLSRAGKTVLARGQIEGDDATRVTLQSYVSRGKGRPYRRVGTRTATVRNGRFKTKLSQFRHGSWRVIARVQGSRLRGAGEVSLGGGVPQERVVEVPVQAGFGSTITPGPLAGGGFIARGSAARRAVVFVQSMLAVAGVSVTPTGRFDARTERAVLRFQREQGLLVDGIVGRQTMAALQSFQRDPR